MSKLRCSISASDVRGVTRLTGARDEDVGEPLAHCRVMIRFKAGVRRPNDEEYADNVTLQHTPLLCDGQCCRLIQHIFTGQIDTSPSSNTPSEPDVRGSYPIPGSWSDFTRVNRHFNAC